MKSKVIKSFFVILILSLVSEMFLFNFSHWESRFYNAINTNYNISYSEGFYNNGDGTITILPDKEQTITFENINQNVENVKLNISIMEPDWKYTFNTKIYISDEGSSDYYLAGEHLSVNQDLRSMFARIHTFGKLNNLKLEMDFEPYTIISHNAIAFNQRVPFELSIFRLAAIFSILFLIWLFRSKSELYSLRLSKTVKKIVIGVVIVLQVILFTSVCRTNPAIMHGEYEHFKEYPKLAVALSKGNFYLDDKPSQELMDLSNPYDTQLRIEKEVDYLWDYAYFEGKYYVYFGAGPVLLYYLPYYLVTGNALPNYIAIILSLTLFIIFTHLLINKIAMKYFSKVPFPIPLLLSSGVVFGSGAFFIAHKPDSYSVPIITGLAFMVMGLYFWIDAKNDTKINNYKVTVGSICMAFVLFCRPQMILMAFVAIPLFWEEICLLSRSAKCRTSFICAIVPFLILGLILGYYNYARFGSPFDFGANYNLTTNDMTKRGIELGRTFDGLFKYLFELPILAPVFPFLYPTSLTSNYIGLTIYESTYGGLFATNIILWINLFVVKCRNLFQNKKLFYICLISLCSGLVIVFMDVQMAGILQRYFSDFAFFFFLPACILLFVNLEKHVDKKWIKEIYFIIFVLVMITICFNLLFFLITDQTNISQHNPKLYYKLYNMLQW